MPWRVAGIGRAAAADAMNGMGRGRDPGSADTRRQQPRASQDAAYAARPTYFFVTHPRSEAWSEKSAWVAWPLTMSKSRAVTKT